MSPTSPRRADRALRLVVENLSGVVRRSGTTRRRPPRRPGGPPPDRSWAYPGDFDGRPDLAYTPDLDGQPDPGEVVWTWVPFEEDHRRGKDRPVLLVGRDGPWLLGVGLTSRDHDRDPDPDSTRHWVDVGFGGWDRDGRPSEARVDRIVRVDPGRVRREGAIVAPAVFARIAAAIRHLRG